MSQNLVKAQAAQEVLEADNLLNGPHRQEPRLPFGQASR